MNHRILAAEDSPTQAAVLRSHLEEAGFTVAVAADGAEALALMEAEPFDLVVSDVVMPDVDGYELCRGIKDRHPQVPVVLLTSLTDPLDVVHALAAGADNFLRKPYEPKDLLHRVRNMLHNKELRESGRAQMGLELFFLGRRFMINSDREQILDLLVSTFEDLVTVNERLRAREDDLARAHEELSHRLAETELERDRLDAVLAAIPGGVAVFDTDARIVNANASLAEVLGVNLPSLRGALAWDAMPFVDHGGNPVPQDELALSASLYEGRGATRGTAFDLFVSRPDGARVPVVARAAPVRGSDGGVVGAVGTLEDLRMLMENDPVTGLPGHGTLVDRLQAVSDSAAERGMGTGMLVVILDRFRRIRESLPGSGSDQVVIAVVDRLRRALASPDIQQRSAGASAAYLGNGEVALILPEIQDEADAVVVAQLVAERLAGPVELDGVEIEVTVSAAVGLYDGGTDAAGLVASVAAAARMASSAGGANVATSDPALHAQVANLLRREGELRKAIVAGHLVTHYQPQVNVRDGRPVAVEALVRWQHPDRGLLGAAEVIPLAVESGLIGPVGWWVLDDACRQAAEWRRSLAGGEALVLSVNLAAEQLCEPDAADRIAAVLATTGLDPTALILEITEGSVMDDPDVAIERLNAIRSLGVQLAIDDFGTGYSSLLQLRRLPVDVLKIDRNFVSGMLDEPADGAIVAGMVRLARALGLEIVAEGVETLDQLVQLRVLGCDLGQGYHWAKPMAADDLSRWWSERAQTPHFDDPVGTATDTDDHQDEAISYLVHELRSPLAAITGYAELLSETSPAASSPDFVDAIVRNARELENRMAALTEANDVLRGGITLHLEDRDVADLVQTLAGDIGPQLAPHSVDLSVAGPAVAAVDAARLVQAMTNLLTNAAKFAPPETPIEVSVSTDETVVRISVRDHGPGVPEHRRQELFRRFSRLGARTKGMGIGLYLARSIVDAHGGVLRYEPAPGGGAIFSILLPRRPVNDPQDRAGGSRRRHVSGGDSSSEASGRGRRPPRRERTSAAAGASATATVLCFEDDAATAQLIERTLTSGLDVEVLIAADGAQGLELASEHRPDLAVVDLNMGRLSGEEVLQTLRSDVRTATVPVVILSADTSPGRAGQLLSAGAVAVIQKPFQPHHLRDTVAAALGGRPGPAIPPPTAGPAPSDDLLDPMMIAALQELDFASGDAHGTERLVETVVADAQGALVALRAAAELGDVDEVGRLAHALRGSTANVGARLLAERCRELETMAANRDLRFIPGAIVEVASALQEADRALRLRIQTVPQ